MSDAVLVVVAAQTDVGEFGKVEFEHGVRSLSAREELIVRSQRVYAPSEQIQGFFTAFRMTAPL
jgi:hypothetical protein